MTRSHFIEIFMILTKYVFDVSVRLTENSVTVESIKLRFYCTLLWLKMVPSKTVNIPDIHIRSFSSYAT